MMIIDVRQESCARQIQKALEEENTPLIMLRRDAVSKGRWRILQDKVPMKQANWTLNKSGEHVAIPMHEYKLQEDTHGQCVLFGAQLGALAASMVARKFNAEKLLIYISEPFKYEDESGIVFYAGVAAKEA